MNLTTKIRFLAKEIVCVVTSWRRDKTSYGPSKAFSTKRIQLKNIGLAGFIAGCQH